MRRLDFAGCDRERAESHRQRRVAASARMHGRTKDCGRSKVLIITFDGSHTLTTRYEPAALARTLCERRAARCQARAHAPPLPIALTACSRPHGACFAICRALPHILAPAHQSGASQALLLNAHHHHQRPIPLSLAVAYSATRSKAGGITLSLPRPARITRRPSAQPRQSRRRGTSADPRRERGGSTGSPSSRPTCGRDRAARAC